MAEIDFNFTIKEHTQLVETVLSDGFILVPSLHYNTTKNLTVQDVLGFQRFADASILYFIIHKKDIDKGFKMDFFEKDGERKYFIVQKEKIPYLDFYVPRLINESHVRSSNIGILPYYYDNGLKVEMPIEYKTFYKKLSSLIKKNSVPVKIEKRTFWIGRELLKLARQKKVKISSFSEEDILNKIDLID